MVVSQYRRRSVLRAAFFFLVPAWLVSAQTDALEEQSRRGKDLMAQGRFEDAAGVYRAMVKAMCWFEPIVRPNTVRVFA